MKKTFYILCIFAVLLTFVNCFFCILKQDIKINNNINLGNILVSKNYSIDSSYADGEIIKLINRDVSKNLEYEKNMIDFIKNVNSKFFDYNVSFNDFITLYYERRPYNIFGSEMSSNFVSTNLYNINGVNIYKFRKTYVNESLKYNGIKKIELNYLFDKYYSASVELNDFYYNNVLFDNIIVNYQIVFEKNSNNFKICGFSYYDMDYVDEIYNSDSNIKNFNNDLSDIENVDEALSRVKDSIVTIEVYDKDKLVDKVSGFFISENWIVTTADIFDSNYNYVIKNDNANYTFYKVLGYSKIYNTAILEINEKVEYDFDNFVFSYMNDDNQIIVTGYDSDIYIGKTLPFISEQSFLIGSNIVFTPKDRGKLVLDTQGRLIGMYSGAYNNKNFFVGLSFIYDILYGLCN